MNYGKGKHRRTCSAVERGWRLVADGCAPGQSAFLMSQGPPPTEIGFMHFNSNPEDTTSRSNNPLILGVTVEQVPTTMPQNKNNARDRDHLGPPKIPPPFTIPS